MALVVLATFSYALMLISLSRGPIFTNAYLVGTLINVLGALIPFSLFAIGGMRMDGPNNLLGVVWGILGGIGIALFTITMARLFAGGGSLGFVSPLVYGGAIVVVTLVGVAFFQESVRPLHWIGVMFILIGISIVVFSERNILKGAN